MRLQTHIHRAAHGLRRDGSSAGGHRLLSLTLTLAAALGACWLVHKAGFAAETTATRAKAPAAAEVLDLLKARDDGLVSVQVRPKDATEFRVKVTNNTEQPLQLQLRPGMMAVPVLAQFGGGLGGGGLGGGLGGGGGGQAGGLGGGGYRAVFDVVPGASQEMKLMFVCCEYGKPDPRPTMKYDLKPVAEWTHNVALQELVTLIAEQPVSQKAAQAAAWHIAHGMGWDKLASLGPGGRFSPGGAGLFTAADISAAQQIANLTRSRVSERVAAEAKSPKPARHLFLAVGDDARSPITARLAEMLTAHYNGRPLFGSLADASTIQDLPVPRPANEAALHIRVGLRPVSGGAPGSRPKVACRVTVQRWDPAARGWMPPRQITLAKPLESAALGGELTSSDITALAEQFEHGLLSALVTVRAKGQAQKDGRRVQRYEITNDLPSVVRRLTVRSRSGQEAEPIELGGLSVAAFQTALCDGEPLAEAGGSRALEVVAIDAGER